MLKAYTEDCFKAEGWSVDHTIRIVAFQGILYYYDITNPYDTLSEYPLRPMEGPEDMEGPEEELTSILLLDILEALNREDLSPQIKYHRSIARIQGLRALKAYIEGLLI